MGIAEFDHWDFYRLTKPYDWKWFGFAAYVLSEQLYRKDSAVIYGRSVLFSLIHVCKCSLTVARWPGLVFFCLLVDFTLGSLMIFEKSLACFLSGSTNL